jgi:hypothetical protein
LIQLATLSAQKERAEKSTAALLLVMLYSSNEAKDCISSMEAAIAQSSLHANLLCSLNIEHFARVLELEKDLKDRDQDICRLKDQLRTIEAERVKAQERKTRLRYAEELIPILVASMSSVSLYIIANTSVEIDEISKKCMDDEKAKEMKTLPQEPLRTTNDEHTNSGDEVLFYLFLYHLSFSLLNSSSRYLLKLI